MTVEIVLDPRAFKATISNSQKSVIVYRYLSNLDYFFLFCFFNILVLDLTEFLRILKRISPTSSHVNDS